MAKPMAMVLEDDLHKQIRRRALELDMSVKDYLLSFVLKDLARAAKAEKESEKR